MSTGILFVSTYQWTCNTCLTEVLAIRRNETKPLGSVLCPTCGIRILLQPSIRREQQPQLKKLEMA